MDEWESVKRKIKELEASFLNSSPEVRSTLDSLSVADFWKRRYEEEKKLWESKLAAKERDQVDVQEKVVREEKGTRELEFRIKELEQRLEAEKKISNERGRVKELQDELEKREIEWKSKMRLLENDNEDLRAKLRKASEPTETELELRKELEDEKLKLSEEAKKAKDREKASAHDFQNKLERAQMERDSLQKQLQELFSLREIETVKSSEFEKGFLKRFQELDQQISLLKDRKRKQMETFESLAAGFAQKIKRNMGMATGSLEECIQQFDLDEELKGRMETTREVFDQLLKTTEDFLALSKSPGGAARAYPLNELLLQRIAELEPRAAEHNAAIERRLSENIPDLRMDKPMLGEAFKEILANAFESMPHGGAIAIETRYDVPSQEAIVRIDDQGKGIEEKLMRRIFEPYFTTKKGKKGLGLAIAKRAVELHHGVILIYPKKEGGTSVEVRLPVQLSF